MYAVLLAPARHGLHWRPDPEDYLWHNDVSLQNAYSIQLLQQEQGSQYSCYLHSLQAEFTAGFRASNSQGMVMRIKLSSSLKICAKDACQVPVEQLNQSDLLYETGLCNQTTAIGDYLGNRSEILC